MKTILAFQTAILIIGLIIYLFSRLSSCKSGLVTNKIYLPSYTEEIDYYSVLLDAPMIEKRRYPEKYMLVLEVNSQKKQCEVSETIFEDYSIGDLFLVK